MKSASRFGTSGWLGSTEGSPQTLQHWGLRSEDSAPTPATPSSDFALPNRPVALCELKENDIYSNSTNGRCSPNNHTQTGLIVGFPSP